MSHASFRSLVYEENEGIIPRFQSTFRNTIYWKIIKRKTRKKVAKHFTPEAKLTIRNEFIDQRSSHYDELMFKSSNTSV